MANLDDTRTRGGIGPRVAGSLAPLANVSYRRLWIGQTVSAAGDALALVAVAFAVLRAGGGAADIGYVAAARAATSIGLILAGGVWADRLPRQVLMLAADGVRMAVQACIGVLLFTGRCQVWELVAGAAVYGAAESLFDPAVTGLIPELVPEQQLLAANSLIAMVRSMFRIGGPAVAGVLVALFGPAPVFAVDAATFVVSAISLSLLRLPMRGRSAAGSFRSDLAAGWREITARSWYWQCLLAHAFGNFALPVFLVLGPVIAVKMLGGPSAWGLISASIAAGEVTGGLVSLRLRVKRPLVFGNLIVMLTALPALALAGPLTTWAIAIAAALSGIGVVVLNNLWTATMQVVIPDELRSRVGSYDWLISLLVMPAGFAVAGPVAATAGNVPTLVGAAALLIVPCAVSVLIPAIRAVKATAGGQIVAPAPRRPAIAVTGRSGRSAAG